MTKTVLDGESQKPYSSRNQEQYETQDKPVILEEPEEESKEDKVPKLEQNKEQPSNFATIDEKLPASATEIDPTPAVEPMEEEFQTSVVNPEIGKIKEEEAAKADEVGNDNPTSLVQENDKSPN